MIPCSPLPSCCSSLGRVQCCSPGQAVCPQPERDRATGNQLHGQESSLQGRGRLLHGCSHPENLRVMLDTLGFGDKAVPKLSARSSPHSSLPGQTEPGEVLLGVHTAPAGPAGCWCSRMCLRCRHRVVAQGLGVKGDKGLLFRLSPGKLPCAIHHWPVASLKEGKSAFFSNQGLAVLLWEHLLVFLGDQSQALRRCHRLLWMVSLLGSNKGMSRSGGM